MNTVLTLILAKSRAEQRCNVREFPNELKRRDLETISVNMTPGFGDKGYSDTVTLVLDLFERASLSPFHCDKRTRSSGLYHSNKT